MLFHEIDGKWHSSIKGEGGLMILNREMEKCYEGENREDGGKSQVLGVTSEASELGTTSTKKEMILNGHCPLSSDPPPLA